MEYMFYGASAFNQDLGWCVDNYVSLRRAFYDTQCASTSCGVKQVVGGCAPTLAPRTSPAPTVTSAPTATPLVADDNTIKTAAALWFSDSHAAIRTYGHISTWETGGVGNMDYLFCGGQTLNHRCTAAAASFNEDISAWDTSGVTSMVYMFYGASAFDQDLGWCVDDDDVSLDTLYAAFTYSGCASTSCGILPAADLKCGGGPMSDFGIRTAVAAWLSNATAAEATYGHISTWETGRVTDMSKLFQSKGSFNEDIGAWDTSGVTDMGGMFSLASAFNQDIGDWAVHSVTDMRSMFFGASSFNQPLVDWRVDMGVNMRSMFDRALAFDQALGWCVGNDVDSAYAFFNTKCAALSCGVVQGVCPDHLEAVAGDYCKLSNPELCSGSRVSFVEAPSNPFASISESRYSVPMLADVDGDGNDDLLVGQEDGSLVLYRHAESGYVVGDEEPFKNVTVGGHATPALVDLDGDGLLDLIVGAQGGGLAFYTNAGTDTTPVFTKVSDAVTPCGDNLKPVNAAECPTDPGDLPKCDFAACGDLCEADGECGTNTTLDNCGEVCNIGACESGDVYRKLCDARPGPFAAVDLSATYTAPAFADIDGDGLVDLVFGKETSGALTFYKNVGSSTTTKFQIVRDGPFANVLVGSFSKPTFYDLDNDGDQDLIVGDDVGDVLLFLNVGSRFSPSFSFVEDAFAGIIPVHAAPTLGVLNGIPSLVVGSSPGQLVVYGETPKEVEFVTTKVSPFAGIDVGDYSKPAFVDLDNDGDQDLVVGEDDGTLHYYRNVGTPSQPNFQKVDEENPFDGSDVNGDRIDGDSAPTFVDLNGDGLLDLVVGAGYMFYDDETNSGKLFYYRNVGTPSQPKFEKVGCVDDLTTRDEDGNDCSWYQDDDGYNFYPGFHDDPDNCGAFDDDDFTASEQCCACGGGASESPFHGIDVGDHSTPSFADLDNDGDLDLVVGVGQDFNEPSSNTGKVLYYRNVGTSSQPSFEKVDEGSPFDGIDVGVYSTPALVDLDGDRDLDLVVGEDDGYLYYFRNAGTPTQPVFEKVEVSSPFEGIDVGDYSAPTFADLDNDGDPDLVVGDDQGRLSYFQNADSCRKAVADGACSSNGICSAYKDGEATCDCISSFVGAQCDTCAAGAGYSGEGDPKCKPCGQNEVSAAGSTECDACPEDYFSEPGASICKQCPSRTSRPHNETACIADPRDDKRNRRQRRRTRRTLILVLSIIGAALFTVSLCWACCAFRTYARRKQELERERAVVVREQTAAACEKVEEFQAHFVTVSGARFMKFDRLHPQEKLRDELIIYDSVADVKDASTRGRVFIFFSHQWLGWSEPDPQRIHVAAMQQAVHNVSKDTGTSLEKIRVWVDYVSIPQKNRSEQKLAIASLPTFASCCDYFVVVAPDATHRNTGCACNSKSYRRRAWCRAEIMSCWARNGTSDMYFNTNEGLKPLVVSDEILHEALDVIGGEYTCCRLGHPNRDPCDREELMLPLLGLYADIYRERHGKHAEAYAFIEPIKHRLFPATFDYLHRDSDGVEMTTTQVLFGDLVAAVEYATDHEKLESSETPGPAPDFKPGTHAQRHSLRKAKHGHGSKHGSGSKRGGSFLLPSSTSLSLSGSTKRLSRYLFQSSGSRSPESFDSEVGESSGSTASPAPAARPALSRSLTWRASVPNLGHHADDEEEGDRAPL